MSDEAHLRATEQFFHEQIPLTRAMGVRVESYDGEKLVLTAPPDANHNHLGTAFGGSLAAIATLAGYGLVWLELGDRTTHIVVRETSISYRRPVRGIIRAICQRPETRELASFHAALQAKGKARLQLRVTVEEDEAVAVEFTGTFVALR